MDEPWPRAHVSLDLQQSEPINRLPGFRKTHRVPTRVNSSSRAFVETLTAPQLQDDLDKVFRKIRKYFRFRREELSAHDEHGIGTITTPYFQYESIFMLGVEDCSRVIWHRCVSRMTNAEQVVGDAFQATFGRLFDTVVFRPPQPLDLEALIDRIETMDDDRVDVEYDRNITHCKIAITGTRVHLHVEPEAFRIVHPRRATPRELVQSLIEIQESLIDLGTLQLAKRP